jgi:hypothetical protein
MNLDEFKGIKLDIGCGAAKSAGWVGLDKRKLDCVDIVHDLEETPWPIEANSAVVILASHILEHIDPRNFLAVMAEIHRVGMHFCQVQISTPYAGSYGAYQDPTHTRPGFNEASWTYFDPRPINGQPSLWRIYEPPPLFVEQCHWDVNGNCEVLMRVIKDKKFLKKVLNGSQNAK